METSIDEFKYLYRVRLPSFIGNITANSRIEAVDKAYVLFQKEIDEFMRNPDRGSVPDVVSRIDK